MNRNGFDDFDLFVTCEEFYNDSDEWELFYLDDEDTEEE